ncbi:MAG: lamin tail domain-containing protein [Verrucomicrobiota bacterium]
MPRPSCSATTSPTRRARGPGASRRFALLPWLALLACAQPLQAALPPGWTDADIASPALAGAASFTAGLWTLSGGGTDICTYDQLHFASKLVTGDGLLVARVESLQNAPAAQAGVMFRNDLSAGALEVAVLVTASSGVSFQWRGSPGVTCSYQVVLGVPNLGAPIWLSLARSGNSFSAYWSTNNITWYQVGSTQIVALEQTALAGLAVSANNNAALATATFTGVSLPPSFFGVYRQLWTDLNPGLGNTLAALTNSADNLNWPDNPNPDFTAVYASFLTESNTGMNYYGQRLRAFVVPPMTGAYTFWIASDDTSELLLSADETASLAAPVAWVNGSTNPEEWTRETNQQSAPMLLQAGRRYYLEALMQQGTGNDNLAVRWQLPNGTNEEPLAAWSAAGTRLVPCTGLDSLPGLYLQPTNLTVSDGYDALFAVLATNQSALSYQWLLNGTNLSGPNASADAYTVSNANAQLNNNQFYCCVVSNAAGVVTSAVARLGVLADTTPPTVVRATEVNATNAQLVFSEPLEAASATNQANYVFTNGLPLSSVQLSADLMTVTLTTAPLAPGSNYVLLLNGIRDRSNAHNPIATNTAVSLLAGPYSLQGVGSPTPPGSIWGATGGYDVGGGGKDISGVSDQFQFVCEILNGDFDLEVRLASLTPTDVFAKAGLMAREDLTPGARFAAVLATPAMNGSFFAARTSAGGGVTVGGNLPVNYPQTWLRLQRTGNQFTGYAGLDGQTWQQLGTATIVLTNPVYFGMVVCSHNPSQAALAQFRDLSPVTAPLVGAITRPNEPLGPSSRKTPIAITEIMYKPAPRSDTNNLEFLEVYNSNPWFHDLSGYRLVANDLSFTFPPKTILAGGAFLVIAASPQSVQNVYGITNVVGPYTGSLKKAGTLQLLDEVGAVLLSIPYSNLSPWPVAADGTGHSLVLVNPTYGEGDPRAWDLSDVVGGSPGQMEAFRPSPLRHVLINEFLAHTDPPDYDYLELYNQANSPVDISGCILTDDPATNKFVVPPGTVIPARGFVFYSETNMNFRLSAAGETIYLKSPDQGRYLDAVQFGGQENGVATGRWPDGASQFYRLTAKTPGAPNAAIRPSDIVLNELMYDPISGNDDDQYIELYNRSAKAVNLGGWQLSDAVSFTFPADTLLAADSYLVVARNAARLRPNYPNLNLTNCLGDFAGKLSHNGEHLALTMPDTITSTNSQGLLTTTPIHIIVNDVTYGTGGRWGQWAAGGGSSLELIDPNSNNRLAANWADSDETQKSSWVNVETTGLLDNGANYDASIDYAQIGLLDVGECLVDNIEVRAGATGANLVANPDFESGTLNNWSLQGDHARSSLENSGYASSYSLHLRSSDRMWTGVNSCQVALSANTLAAGQTATLRFKARWLRGWPEVLLRVNGNWLEATGRMPLPANLGTPGARNSRYLTNAGPAIYEVTHTPSLPATAQPVVVSARLHDPDGVQSLTLNYRLDPAATYTAVPMKDDGTGGDALAGDGIFSASIPGQGVNRLVAFYLSAADSKGATTRFPALVNDNAPVRECVVMFGDSNPATSFGVYHLWITQANASRWTSLGDLSNESHDLTFVTGPRVIYNAQGRFAGSPYHQNFDTPYGSLCHYKLSFQDDDALLGATSFNKIHQPGNGAGDDASLQREQLANTFLRALGVPWLNRRFVAVYVNGNRRGQLMEDAQTPDNDVVKEHFPNDKDGWLYKMQPWFEFAPFLSGTYLGFANQSWCTLMPYTTTGGAKKTARYRYSFEVRRTPVSANDFTNVFSLVDAASAYGSPGYSACMQNLADMENWMRVFAANHAAGNWDAFGCPNGQNLYGYMGALGARYSLLMFDFNIVFGNSGSWGAGQNLFAVNGADPNTGNIYNEPTFRRMYWRALQELVNGPLNVANSGPLLDAKYNAFVANGLAPENPNSAIKGWLTSARSSINSQIAAENVASFTVDQTVTLSYNVAFLTGKAPFTVKTVWVNGVQFPLTWTSVTAFRVAVPLQPGTNQLNVVGVDLHGQPVAGASKSVAAIYSGSLPSPVGQVVLNELMCNPALLGADYVELYNNSTTITYDLSGWELRGLAYVFPPGSQIGPNSFLVLAQDRAAFAAAYGATKPLFDVFSGTLQTDGETLTLLQPATNAATDLVVAKVRYASGPPWPASTPGSSLQLIDPRQDNWRAGNWAVCQTNASGNQGPQWQYVSLTGLATRPILLICLHGTAGDCYLDDLKLVAGSVPEAGPNLLTNGDFEGPLSGPWTVSPNLAGSLISTAVQHSGQASLHVIATSPGDTIPLSIWENTAPIVTNDTYTLSYWFLPSSNGSQLLVRLSGSALNNGTIYSLQNLQPPPVTPFSPATPDTANSVLTNLPPFPPLWLNELQADNYSGITNRAGQRTPWLELYNPSSNTLSLTGLYLANNYSNLTQWAFPTNSSIYPGQFMVIFADGQTNLSTTNELHASFVLPSLTGSLALSRLFNGQPQVLDYLDYANLAPDYAYGSFPDGQAFTRQPFYYPTPGGPNNGAIPPSFVPYTAPGSVYTQDFDSLPNPGATSVNSDNPVTINGITYSLPNPFDFAQPSAPSGQSGGLGLAPLAGWYGLAAPGPGTDTRFGASYGDQTAGGQISFGLPDSTNRALGLLATSSTGSTAFGAKLINLTATTLNRISLQFTGELWRQSDKAKTLQFYYLVDPTAAQPCSTNYTAFLPSLNVSFPTLPAAVGGLAVDGTLAANQTNLSLLNQVIANWPPGAALWLVWEIADPAGKAQGLAIDNLSFSASAGEPTNTAPVLAPPGDQWVYLGQTLSLALQASDPDVPPQTLTFTLDPGAPAQASLDSASGLFTWTPTPDQVPSANPVTVRVTDNGQPPLSASQTFTLIAVSAPRLGVLSLTGNLLTIAWPTVPGAVYRLQYKDDLAAPAWTTLGNDLLGTGDPLSLTLDIATASPRFYRLLVVN